MSQPNGWAQFLFLAHRSPEGREAFRAYREQRELALAAPAKLNLLAHLLERHNGDRVLIFTHDNATVYTIARQFLVPVITHQTKTKERREILLRFNAGTYPDRRHVARLERGRERPRGQRGDRAFGLGLGARARPAAGAGAPQVGQQGRHALRGDHPRDRRGIHLQPAPQARRLRRKLSSIMLTGDLVRAKTTKQRVIPLYLDRTAEPWLEAAESLLLLFREGTGMTRGQIESEIDELFGGGGKATQVYRGLAKVLEDRAEFEVVSDVPPEELREKVFTRGRRLSPSSMRAARAAAAIATVFRRDEIITGRRRRPEPGSRGRGDRALRRPAR